MSSQVYLVHIAKYVLLAIGELDDLWVSAGFDLESNTIFWITYIPIV